MVQTTKAGEKEWTASEKLRVLGGGEPALVGEAFGALLRREGLHEAQVTAWRAAAAEALSAEAASGGSWNSAQSLELAEAKKRLKELERDALRKDKALAEAAALLLLEKNSSLLGGTARSQARERGATSDLRVGRLGGDERCSSGGRLRSPWHFREDPAAVAA